MPNDLVVRPLVISGLGVEMDRHPSAATAEPPAPAPTPMGQRANPSLRLDPALGLVVMEFRNEAGKVTESFPDTRQLDAYRAAQRTGAKAGDRSNDDFHKASINLP